eukprot:CAMPEP_0172861426 /NCGR_PEP_ID=MMETSP1075-20121228/72654_1 /TAXON_ID=2916 /ORGANISM="Ceratium fusus, Strain PA161109" /LENGTH=59 /DNA_ID=CAMNT_0013709559 /DNA_START=50 /DNA_END=229 /DNA_ORIENTATION=+
MAFFTSWLLKELAFMSTHASAWQKTDCSPSGTGKGPGLCVKSCSTQACTMSDMTTPPSA